MEVSNTEFPSSSETLEATAPTSPGDLPNPVIQENLSQAAPSQATHPSIPGLPQDYRLVLQASTSPMDQVARLKILGDRRSTASLGLFVVLFFGLTLTILAVGEALRIALPAATAFLDMVMALTLILMLISPVALAAMLGISLGQAIRQPRQRTNPDLERRWLLQRGNQTVGQLRLLPEALRLRLLWVNLQANYRGQGIGSAFVRAVLEAESQPCRVKLSGDRDSAQCQFFQNCGFQLPPEAKQNPERSMPWSKPNNLWMNYVPHQHQL